MKVLVDTSVWIEFLRKKPQISDESLSRLYLLLEEDRVVTIYPIHVELFSGSILPQKRKEIEEAFESMAHVDLDWNSKITWVRLIEMAQSAKARSLPIPGVIDRMILSSAEASQSSLWTLDRALIRLAEVLKVPLFV